MKAAIYSYFERVTDPIRDARLKALCWQVWERIPLVDKRDIRRLDLAAISDHGALGDMGGRVISLNPDVLTNCPDALAQCAIARELARVFCANYGPAQVEREAARALAIWGFECPARTADEVIAGIAHQGWAGGEKQ